MGGIPTVIALTHSQLQQIKTCAFQLPYGLRRRFWRRVAELLPQDFGDADVWRAGQAAAREAMQAPNRAGGGLRGDAVTS
jgi:hypothetical protein